VSFAGLDALAVDGSIFRFAQANGLTFQRRSRPPALSGGPYERYTNAKVRGSVTGPGWMAGNLDIGDGAIRWQTSFFGIPATAAVSGPMRDSPTAPIGYLALTLSRQMPNMILDSKQNDSALGSSLVHPPTRDQQLLLEGDFNTHFALYVPSGYERDALYIFTPDLMALLIDETGDCDVEIRGDQLVIYYPGGLDLSRPETWRWIGRIMSVVGAKTYSRTGRYSDERVTGDAVETVAPHAQRLRRQGEKGPRRSAAFSTAIVVGMFIAALLLVVAFTIVLG
jgi:hypothetical protein